MKKITSICLSFLIMSSLNVAADQCCSSCCISEWTIQADWLYWNVRKCGLDYAWREEFNDPDDPNIPNELGKGAPKQVVPCYDNGIRIALFNRCDDWKFGARYIYYNNNEKGSFFDEELNYQASRVLPGTRNDSYEPESTSYVESNFDFARSRYNIELNIVDIEANRIIEDSCDRNMSLFTGFRFACMDQDLKSEYGNEENFSTDRTVVKEKNNMKAYGLYLGSEGKWNFCGGFGFFGRFSLASFVANIDRSFHQFNLNSTFDFVLEEVGVNGESVFEVADVNDELWCHVNAVEFAVGIDSQICQCMCVDWNIRIGYELHTWFNMQDFINFCGTHSGIEGHPARQKDSIGFDGLFLRLGSTF